MLDVKKSNPIKIWLAKKNFGTGKRISLYKKIKTFLDDGVSLNDIIIRLADEYEKSSSLDVRVTVLRSWSHEMAQGASLSKAMHGWAPAGELMLIKAGEESGDIGESFGNAISSTEAAKAMSGTILGSLSYPGIMLILLFLIIYVFSVEAVPKLAATIPPEEWPEDTKALYSLSQFVQYKWWMALGFMGGVIYFLSWSLGKMNGVFRKKILDRIPPYSMYRSFQSSIFLISSSAMIKSGIPLFDAMKGLRKMSNPYVRSHIDVIIDKMEKGESNSMALNSGFLDKETGLDISIYGNTSDIQGAMEVIGRAAIANSLSNIKKISSILSIVALASVAGFIFWVYYCFFTLSQSIG